jgi:hypothetical protein
MSEILKVLNRKSVELKSERLDLSMMDDVKKELSIATKSYNKAADLWVGVVGAKELAAKQINKAESEFKSARRLFENLQKSAAGLGVDLPSDIEKMGNVNEQLATLKDFAKDVKI